MPWYVIYTKPNTEIKTAETLQKLGVKVFCPVIQEVRQWSDRKKRVTVPLFKSYVFVNLTEKERNIVFEAPGAVRYLFWLGKPAIVRDYEIKEIEKWLERDDLEDFKMSSLEPGQELALQRGVFKGHKGIVKEVGKKRIKMYLPKMGMLLEAGLKDIME